MIATLLDTATQLAAHARPLATPDLHHVADAYLEDLRSRTKPGYWRKAEQRLRSILLSCPTAAPADVRRFRTSLLSGGTSKQTANYYVDALRRCLDWAVDDGHLMPAHDVGRVKPLEVPDAEKMKLRRALTEVEVPRFIEVSIEEDRDRLCPQTTMWRTFIEAGLRWGEAVRAQPEHLVDEALKIPAKSSKTGRARVFPLSHVPDLVEALRRELPFKTPRGEPLPRDSHNALRIFYRTLEKAGIKRRTADDRQLDIHALRWTAATRMIRRGVPLKFVADLLGHADIELLQRGTYVDIGLEDHRAALVKAFAPAARTS